MTSAALEPLVEDRLPSHGADRGRRLAAQRPVVGQVRQQRTRCRAGLGGRRADGLRHLVVELEPTVTSMRR